jgi:hypothetical protein
MEINNALNMKLNQNVGIISPDHLATELTQLKIKSKNSYYPLLNEAIALYEQFNGRIKFFNLGITSSGRSPIPPFMPFLFNNSRNRQTEADKDTRGASPAVFVNMYRIGHWSADEKQYLGVSAITDFYSVLESGLIAYKLLFDNKAEKVFSNKVVLQYLTNIYTSLFSAAVIRTAVTFGSEFNTDAARFIIAKFFLQYVLKKQPSETLSDFAYTAIKNRTSLNALKSFEENSNIDYNSLSSFLETLGTAFFNEKIDISRFEVSWLSMYGEGLVFAIEYVPYLIHFLFASLHGAMLGGSTRLYNRLPDLQKDGLVKLYNAVISELR